MGVRLLGRFANPSRWNRSLGAALQCSQELVGRPVSSSHFAPGIGANLAGIETSADVVTSQSHLGRFWVCLISGVISWGGMHTCLAEELSARPLTAQQEVQLVEDSLQSSESQTSNSHTARWIYTDMGRDLFFPGQNQRSQNCFSGIRENATSVYIGLVYFATSLFPWCKQ